MATTNIINANGTTPLIIGHGGTGVTSVTTAPTATAFSGWDANKNLSANNVIDAYVTTATAAGTTVLTVASAYQQFFTGTTTQTVTLPVTSTLVLGQTFLVVNNSTGTVTVQSSGGNTVTAMVGATQAIFTCILTSGTTAASWSSDYTSNVAGVSSITGTANQVIASASTGAVTLSLPQSIATTSAVTFGSVAFSPTTQGIVGTATNNNASAGYVGEFISSQIVAGSAISLSTTTLTNLTSISLTAGDWDVKGNAVFSNTGTASLFSIGISSTSATFPDGSLIATLSSATFSMTGAYGSPAPTQRFSLSGTTTIYIVVEATFNTGSITVSGGISARRVR